MLTWIGIQTDNSWRYNTILKVVEIFPFCQYGFDSCAQGRWYFLFWLQCTVLESITGWVKKSRISTKMVFNHSYWLLGVFKIQILYLDLFLDLFWAILGLRRPKNGQKIKIVDFPLFFVLKTFLHTIFCILFFWMEYIIYP